MKIAIRLLVFLTTFPLLASPALAAINDWESDDDELFAPDTFTADTPLSPAPDTTGRYTGWKFSTNVFYALSADSYIKGESDTKLDLYGLSLRVDKEFYFGNAPLALDVGLITLASYGTATADSIRYNFTYADVDAQQIDIMEGVTLGVKFNAGDRVWVGAGGIVGLDCRYLYADLDSVAGWYLDDGQLDEFNYGLFYGVYATADFRFSSHFGMNVGVRYVATQVEFDDQLDGLEKDINYILFEIGFTWVW